MGDARLLAASRSVIERIRAQPPLALAFISFALLLACVPRVAAPGYSLDENWVNALNWASSTGKQFGPQIDFTYGPWASLDDISYLSIRILIPALIASVLTGIVFVALAWKLVRAWLGPIASAIFVALIVTPALVVDSSFSERVLLLAVMCAFGILMRSLPRRWDVGIVVALSALAALATLVKISNGVLAAGTVVLIVVFCVERTRRGKLFLLAVVVGAGLLSLVVFWIAAEQHIANIVEWSKISLELTSGYAEAMSIETGISVSQYLLYAVLVLILILQAIDRRRQGFSGLALYVLVGWIAFAALRLGFTRHDLTHPGEAFILLLVTSLALGSTRRLLLPALGSVLAAGAVLVGLGSSYWSAIDPGKLFTNTSNLVSALVSRDYRTSLIESAQFEVQKHYDLPPAIQSAVRHKSVHVDPWSPQVAWAYGLNWAPAPIFQSYAAFTPDLDKFNADALKSASGPQAVIRGQLSAIDNRNAMWETPLYTEALVCNFTPKVQSADWLVLYRSANRCSGPTVSLGSAKLSNGQDVRVPLAPGPGYMVVARASLDQSAANWIASAAFKPISPVFVTVGQRSYRLPRALAGGPLIMKLPSSVGWKSAFGGSTDVTSLRFNQSGTITFTAIPVAAH